MMYTFDQDAKSRYIFGPQTEKRQRVLKESNLP
jgi:hypothetical protein